MEEQFALARTYYRQLEQLTGAAFFRELPLQRFFLRQSEQEFHRRRIEEPRYQTLLSPACRAGELPPELHCTPAFRDELGSFSIHGAGHLDLHTFLLALQKHQQQAGLRLPGTLDYSRLAVGRNEVSYNREFMARAVIFCEGIGILANPWFCHLPFYPVKGESLLFESRKLTLPATIFHHHKWIIPEGSHRFRVGSTYDRGVVEPGQNTTLRADAFTPSATGTMELLTALDHMLTKPVSPNLLERSAGVRPATRDRLPYLGPHPQQPQLYVFNGLGSKGALMAPWLATRLADFLTTGSELPADSLPSRIRKNTHYE